jgi:hypothetical protein
MTGKWNGVRGEARTDVVWTSLGLRRQRVINKKTTSSSLGRGLTLAGSHWWKRGNRQTPNMGGDSIKQDGRMDTDRKSANQLFIQMRTPKHSKICLWVTRREMEHILMSGYVPRKWWPVATSHIGSYSKRHNSDKLSSLLSLQSNWVLKLQSKQWTSYK